MNVGGTIGLGLGLGSQTNEGRENLSTSIHLFVLPDCGCHVTSTLLLPLMPHPCRLLLHDGLCGPCNCEQS